MWCLTLKGKHWPGCSSEAPRWWGPGKQASAGDGHLSPPLSSCWVPPSLLLPGLKNQDEPPPGPTEGPWKGSERLWS